MNPKVVAQALIEMAQKEGVDTTWSRFVRFAKARNLTYLLPEVERYLGNLERKYSEEHTLILETAHTISSELINELKKFVQEESNVDTKHIINKNLVGGFRIRSKGKIFDASIKRHLENLKKTLIGTH